MADLGKGQELPLHVGNEQLVDGVNSGSRV